MSCIIPYIIPHALSRFAPPFNIQSNGNGSDGALESTTPASTNTMYTLKATYDGTTAKLYINGVLDSSAAKSFTYTTTISKAGLGSGNLGESTENFDFGTIHAVRVAISSTSSSSTTTATTTTTPCTSVEATSKPCCWAEWDNMCTDEHGSESVCVADGAPVGGVHVNGVWCPTSSVEASPTTTTTTGTQPMWKIVFEETKGDGNGAQFDNSDIRTLHLLNPPFDVAKGDYSVRLEWNGASGDVVHTAEFTVPKGQDIFGDFAGDGPKDIPVVDVSTSSDSNFGTGIESAATFCHACKKNGHKWGDTCWALVPSSDSNRGCGCNSGGWAGNGIYYGGYKSPDSCGGQGGGFAGPKSGGQPKGDLASLGLILKIKSNTQHPPAVPADILTPFTVNQRTETQNIAQRNINTAIRVGHADVHGAGYASITLTYYDNTVDTITLRGNGGNNQFKDAAGNWMDQTYGVSILSKTVKDNMGLQKEYRIECTSTTGTNTWEYETLSGEIKSVSFAEDSGWSGLKEVTMTYSDTSTCTLVSCDANTFDTNHNVNDGCEASCPAVTDGTCTSCSSSTTCTAVTCDVNKLDANSNANDGCEASCPAVPDGTCTSCSSSTTCTAVTCDVNKFDINNNATDGCEQGCPVLYR